MMCYSHRNVVGLSNNTSLNVWQACHCNHMTTALKQQGLPDYIWWHGCRFFKAKCVAEWPLTVQPLWRLQALHAGIVNVCWTCCTVTKGKKIWHSEAMEFLVQKKKKEKNLDIRQKRQKQCPSSKCKWLGQRSPSSPAPSILLLPPLPPLTPILLRALRQREIHPGRDYCTPASNRQTGMVKASTGQGVSFYSPRLRKRSAVLLEILPARGVGQGWAVSLCHLLPGVRLRNCCYHNKASRPVAEAQV